MNLLKKSDPSDNDYQLLLKRSIEELKIKTAAHDGLFQLGTASWSADLEEGIIVFTSPNGMKATCALQIIGTINTQDNTWLWSWGNSSIDAKLQIHAQAVKTYGEEHHIKQFTSQKFSCSESDAWKFTAIACKLGNAEGAYRGPAEDVNIFMTYSNVQLSN